MDTESIERTLLNHPVFFYCEIFTLCFFDLYLLVLGMCVLMLEASLGDGRLLDGCMSHGLLYYHVLFMGDCQLELFFKLS